MTAFVFADESFKIKFSQSSFELSVSCILSILSYRRWRPRGKGSWSQRGPNPGMRTQHSTPQRYPTKPITSFVWICGFYENQLSQEKQFLLHIPILAQFIPNLSNFKQRPHCLQHCISVLFSSISSGRSSPSKPETLQDQRASKWLWPQPRWSLQVRAKWTEPQRRTRSSSAPCLWGSEQTPSLPPWRRCPSTDSTRSKWPFFLFFFQRANSFSWSKRWQQAQTGRHLTSTISILSCPTNQRTIQGCPTPDWNIWYQPLSCIQLFKSALRWANKHKSITVCKMLHWFHA